MSERYKFDFPLEPVAKERARKGGRGNWYTPQKTATYEEEIADLTSWQFRNQPLIGRLFIAINLFVSSVRNDIDNLCKSIFDGMQPRKKDGVIVYPGAFGNDNQIDGLYAKRVKVPKGKERSEVIITPIDNQAFIGDEGCPLCGRNYE